MTDSTHSTNIEKELSNLGDPSGRQDSAYWDQWFEVIRAEDHRPFEWYCSVDEVVRVLSHHLADHLNDDSTETKPQAFRIIHPGSGTSLVPLKLRDIFASDQVVVDVSPVAVEEMKQIHEEQYHSESSVSNALEYLVCDILNSPLPFEENSFDCWVDKGFVDAVFSNSESDNQEQSKRLFGEANRLLRGDYGVAVVVSLAEEHSLQLLLDNASTNSWEPEIHVWELHPVSGDMLPFGFVFTKALTDNDDSEKRVVWHSIDGGMDEQTTDTESLLVVVRGRVEGARGAFARSRKLKEKSNAVRKVRATLEVKPYDAETDLTVLGEVLRASTWESVDGDTLRTLHPVWQSFGEDGSAMEQIVPIGFGISKLQLRCIVPSDDVDYLVSAIEEWEGNAVFEGVQSVDVDWPNTLPVGDASDIHGGR
jgi:translation elongation factor EF-1beta